MLPQIQATPLVASLRHSQSSGDVGSFRSPPSPEITMTVQDQINERNQPNIQFVDSNIKLNEKEIELLMIMQKKEHTKTAGVKVDVGNQGYKGLSKVSPNQIQVSQFFPKDLVATQVKTIKKPVYNPNRQFYNPELKRMN